MCKVALAGKYFSSYTMDVHGRVDEKAWLNGQNGYEPKHISLKIYAVGNSFEYLAVSYNLETDALCPCLKCDLESFQFSDVSSNCLATVRGSSPSWNEPPTTVETRQGANSKGCCRL